MRIVSTDNMGLCKSCKEVYGPFEMAGGYCKNCISPKEFKSIKNNDKSTYKIRQEIEISRV